MKFLLFTFFALFVIISHGFSQDKIVFEVDDEWFLKIRKNPYGYNTITQNNIHDGLNITSTFFGFNSGFNNRYDPSIFLSGSSNTAFGFETLSLNTTGFNNTAIGALALREITTGFTNTAIGFSAQQKCHDCTHNVGIGKAALGSNSNGSYNVAIGNDALNTADSAHYTVAIGSTAGVNDSISLNNVYVGFGAGRGTVFATDGYNRNNNVMIGSLSGYQNKTNGNVFLGYQSGYYSNVDNQLYIENSNADSTEALIYGQFDNDLLRINGEVNIDGLYSLPNTSPAVGNVIKYTGGSNLGWDTIDETWQLGTGNDAIYEDGDVGIGIGNAIYRLDVEEEGNSSYIARFRNSSSGTNSRGIIIQTGPNVNPTSTVYYNLFLDGNGTNIGGIRGNGAGGIMYSTTSDRRLKENIKEYTSGLDLVKEINPTIYNLKSNPSHTEIGFIAQELVEVLPQVVSGSAEDDINESPMMVDYGRLTPILVSAIKEQQKIIEQLSQKLEYQEAKFNKLEAKIAQLDISTGN